MPDDLRNRGEPDRSKINLSEDHEVKYWTKHLGVSKEKLAQVIRNGREFRGGGAHGTCRLAPR